MSGYHSSYNTPDLACTPLASCFVCRELYFLHWSSKLSSAKADSASSEWLPVLLDVYCETNDTSHSHDEYLRHHISEVDV
jgi:hypothetical protein